jgi:hypothetical protein
MARANPVTDVEVPSAPTINCIHQRDRGVILKAARRLSAETDVHAPDWY